MKHKILIEVSTVVPIKGYYIPGIGQATKSLVSALNALHDLPYDIELYARGHHAVNFDFYGWTFKHHVNPIPVRCLEWNPSVEPFLRYRLLNYDLFHLTNNYYHVAKGEPFLATIHDCTDMDERFSGDLKPSERQAIAQRLQHMADDSKAIVTVSNSSKAEIVHYFGVKPEKVFVNHLGIDRTVFRELDTLTVKTVLDKFHIHHPFFFACSCDRPRKNLVTALRAFKKFCTGGSDHIFVIAWKNPTADIRSEFAKEINDGKIVFLPFLTDEELIAFYNAASMSVYVSRKEGFGLPILESFACSTPVMTCSNSSIPEVGQDAAIYVGEDQVDEMVDVMKLFEAGHYDLEDFKAKKEKVLQQFSWEHTAQRCLRIYDHLFAHYL